ncbi:UvrD-helicase domain-containing protein [Micromonospora arida]|uniref:UvrD-helicase domain-containing protein n=1 Tax=Micromonospora arida TaxID=2203715 RepID=UPI0033C6C779
MPCSVQLPAGTGKTHVIAAVGSLAANAGERTLVLTHTNAGVDALRRRMTAFGVTHRHVRVETIASWSHSLVNRYPQLAQFSAPQLPNWSDSLRYYTGAELVVSSRAIRRVLAASYDLAVVDEYQDCGADQHALIRALGEILPVAVFGDPLQSIFNFGGNVPITWETDVAARWPNTELPARPWRWLSHNEVLGEWLIKVRTDIITGTPIVLDESAPVTWIAADPANRARACFGHRTAVGSVVAIGDLPHDVASQARNLGGLYTVMEEIEGKEMMKFAAFVDKGDPATVASETAKFAKTCAAKLADVLDTAVLKKLAAGQSVAHLKRQGAQDALVRLSVLLDDPSPVRVHEALNALGSVPTTKIFRHDAWYTILNALRIATSGSTDVAAAVTQLRNRARVTGRRTTQHVISRPVLIKGLEYDHAIILDADAHHPTSLYVALTRARRSLTIISREPVLRPDAR